MHGLKEKRVLVTGGASGIGAATALRFLDEGASVVVLDRDEQALAAFKISFPISMALSWWMCLIPKRLRKPLRPWMN